MADSAAVSCGGQGEALISCQNHAAIQLYAQSRAPEITTYHYLRARFLKAGIHVEALTDDDLYYPWVWLGLAIVTHDLDPTKLSGWRKAAPFVNAAISEAFAVGGAS